MIEVALDTDGNDVGIENDAIMEKNIVNNNTAEDNQKLTSCNEENVADNNHFCNEFQNEILRDSIQNISSDELMSDFYVDVTDYTDRSREHSFKLANEMSNREHK